MQLNHALNKRKPMDITKISSIYSDDILRPFNTEESTALAGVRLSKAGIIFPHGGMIKPNDLCNFYINSPTINVNLNVPITEIRYSNNQWNLYSGEPNPLTKVDKLILANSPRLRHFIQTKYLPLTKSSGTVTWFSATTSSRPLKSIVCGKRTVFPLHKAESEKHLVAASYNNEIDILSPSKATQENYEGAIQNFDFAEILANSNRGNKSGMRCSTPDRIPYIGKLPNYAAIRKKLAYLQNNARKSLHLADDCYWPELYINAAHGSNGAATCPFSAEILASMINEEPLPIGKEILASINPSRMVIRDLKKQKG
jgi:tRNA 5-methylaminomethyl-2-thiouridine biosynthesis bifunctional protein